MALFQSQNELATTCNYSIHGSPLSNLMCLFRGKEVRIQAYKNIPSFSLKSIELCHLACDFSGVIQVAHYRSWFHRFTLKNLTKAPWMKKSMAFASADLVLLRRIRDRLLTLDGQGNQDVL